MSLKLPNSGIKFTLPTTYYARANGDFKNPNLCQPDHYSPQNQLDKMDANDLAKYITTLNQN